MRINNWHILLFASIVIGVFSFVLFSWAGLGTSLGIIIFYFLPLYLILDNYSISFSEKVIFSFFIGIILVPALSYWPARIISLRISIIVIGVILSLIGLLFRFKKNNKVNKE